MVFASHGWHFVAWLGWAGRGMASGERVGEKERRRTEMRGEG